MAILQTFNAPDVGILRQIVLGEKLFDRFSSSRQEVTSTIVLSLAILAERGGMLRTFTGDMTPAVALIADYLLRTSLGWVLFRQAVEAGHTVGAGVVVMPYLFAPVAPHIALVIPKTLLFRLLFLNFLFHLGSFLDLDGGGLKGSNLLLEVGGLSPTIDIRTGNLIGMNGVSVGPSRDEIVAVDRHHP